MTDAEKLAKVRKWAEGCVKFSHAGCSIDEGVWEEIHGKEVLAILDETDEPQEKS